MENVDPNSSYSRPGQTLQALFGSLSNPDFQEIVLERHLIPTLNALPRDQRHQVALALQGAFYDTQMIRKVHDYETTAEINTMMNDLEIECETGRGTASEHLKMVTSIVEIIIEWLPDLWQVGAEACTELDRVHKTLSYCIQICNRLSILRTRAPHTWSELSTRQITVQNSQQDIVFHEEHCDLRHAIMWVWREVLVYADAAGLLLHNNRVSAMIEELRRRGWLAEMRKMIPRGNETHGPKGYNFHRLHWSPQIAANAQALRRRLV